MGLDARKLDFVYANNKGADQSAHPRILISDFVSPSLERSIAKSATCKFQYSADLYIRVSDQKLIFSFLNQNICCGYSKEPS